MFNLGVETLGDGVDEGFGGETRGTAEIAGTFTLSEELMDDGAHFRGKLGDAMDVDVVDDGGVVHGADETLNHAERV